MHPNLIWSGIMAFIFSHGVALLSFYILQFMLSWFLSDCFMYNGSMHVCTVPDREINSMQLN